MEDQSGSSSQAKLLAGTSQVQKVAKPERQTLSLLEILDSELNNGPSKNFSRAVEPLPVLESPWVKMKDPEDLPMLNSHHQLKPRKE